jgi:hypothetical protein
MTCRSKEEVTRYCNLVIFVMFCFFSQQASALIIDEFRLRGSNGANDEFISIYNETGSAHTVAGGGTGYALVASDGVARCIIPNGTIIPATGHYLCVNSTGYSLTSYPAGNGATATGDASYTTNIQDNAGIALFNTSNATNFTLTNRLDAVGSTSESNTLYKEGTGYPALTPFSIDSSWVRDTCGKNGNIANFSSCPTPGIPSDTDNNAADFYFVDTNGTSAGGGQRLGAPSPRNLSSPLYGSGITVDALDSCVSAIAPNIVRDFTSDPSSNSTFGTLDIRRTITNNTGTPITRMRFRIIDLATFPAPSGIADLRPRTSMPLDTTVDRAPCGTGTSNATVQGTTLEQPPSQLNGSGFNGTLSAGTISLSTPLSNGSTIDVRFLLGIQQTGSYKLGLMVESLPGGGAIHEISGCTDGCPSVLSIVRVDPNPTGASSVQYTVTFSTSVTGVDTSDFALTTTGGVSGASITSVSGTDTTYTVTVNTGTGSGTLRLDVADNDSILAGSISLGGNGAGNGNFTAGEVYTLDKTAPTVSINQAAGQADPTTASPINFTATFSEAVTGFTNSDVTLSGTTGASTVAVTGGPTIYNVTVSGMTSSGSVAASINDSAATDAAGNPNTASTSTDNMVTFKIISFTGPTATSTGSATASFTGGGASCTYSATQFIAAPPGSAPVPPTSPPNVIFPHGLFSFSTTACTTGSTLAFTFTYPSALHSGSQYWKYGPTSSIPTDHWYTLPAIIVGRTATFTITDGGLGDDDLIANGIIVSQGGSGASVNDTIFMNQFE